MLQLFWTFLEFHVKQGIILFLVVRKLRLITMIYIVHISAFCWFQTEDVRMHEIMKYAHAFLQSFCLANAPNQALLHQYLELFLTPGVRPIMFNLCIRCISRLWYTVIIIKGWISDRKVLQKMSVEFFYQKWDFLKIHKIYNRFKQMLMFKSLYA